MLQRGLTLHQSGRFAEAEQAYREVLASEPNHFDALHLLGILRAQRGDGEAAVRLIGEALKIQPRSAIAHCNRGNALKDLKRHVEAMDSYDRAVTIKPDYAAAYLYRGNLLLELRRYEEALASFDRMLAIQPDFAGGIVNRGNALYALGRREEALACFDRAITLQPDVPEAYFNRGNVLRGLGRNDEALSSYDTALRVRPAYAEAFNGKGEAFHALGRYEDALGALDQALALRPEHATALNNRGNALVELRRYGEALSTYDRALTIEPDYAKAHSNRGNALQGLGRFEAALGSYDRALAREPNFPDALNNRSNALFELGRYDEALANAGAALALKPDFAGALANRGNALLGLKRYDEALDCLTKAILLQPNLANAYNSRGNTLLELERYDDALADYDKALSIVPDEPTTLNNRGNALLELRRFEAALESFDRAIALLPAFAAPYNGRGNALQSLKRHDEAMASFGKAMALGAESRGVAADGEGDALAAADKAIAEFASVYNNQANALLDAKRFEEALASYDKAIELNPNLPHLYSNRARLLDRLDRQEDAIADLERAVSIDPGLKYAAGDLAFWRMKLCDWTGLDEQWQRVRMGIAEGALVATPFVALSIPTDAALQLRSAQLYAAREYKPVANPLWRGEPYDHDRIRLAYVSADFHNHATAFLTAELFERHDRAKFECIAVSLAGSDGTPMRARLEAAFDRWIDVTQMSDEDAARAIRDVEADIVVDLKGYTENSRLAIFAHRPAPIQVSYLGYPGTIGADFMDYIVADRTVIADGARPFFTEKIVTLPDAYQVNDSTRAIAEPMPRRVDMGLPAEGFVFCCFNASQKITPGIFDIWMQLLTEIEGSVLWLYSNNEAAHRNLRKEASARGVSPDRLVFAKTVRLDEHLSRARLADLVLDTLPYNAHTTASDALWAGAPFLTCMGETFPSRVAASLLTAVGLPELVTHSLAEYKALALKLARDPALLGSIRAKLARNRATAPLFDTDRFRRHIEAAYRTMWERARSGEPPADFAVPSAG